MDKIKNHIEINEKAILSGASGTAKSTIWMRVLCEYLNDGYRVLYYNGGGLDSRKAIDYIQRLNDDKIIIGVDNAHTKSTAGIYHLMQDKSIIEKNVKFILTIRDPDFNRLFRGDRGVESIDDEVVSQAIREFDQEIQRFKISLPSLSQNEIVQFFEHYKKSRSNLETLYDETHGNPLMVRFFLTGNGLENHVIERHEQFIGNNVGRLKAMIICIALDLSYKPLDDKMAENLGIGEELEWLSQAVIDNDNGWKTLHHLWALTWLHHIFSTHDSYIRGIRKKSLTQAIEALATLTSDPSHFEFDKLFPGSLSTQESSDYLLRIFIALFSAASTKITFHNVRTYSLDIDFIINELKIENYFDLLKEKKEFAYHAEAHALNQLKRHEEAIEKYDTAINIKITPPCCGIARAGLYII